jgi:hypothetical protein
MDTKRLIRVLAGTAALVVAAAVAAWAIATLWTYQRYVTDLGSFASPFAWRSLAAGTLEVVLFSGLVCVALRCFGSKDLKTPEAVRSDRR